MAENSAKIDINIHREKNKVLKVNASSTTPIMLEGRALEEIETFTYRGSIVDTSKQGGTDADVKIRISKARTAFLLLKIS